MPLLGIPRLRESSEIPQAGFNVVKQLRTSHALSREVANSQEAGGRCSGFLNIVLETAHPYEVRDRLSSLSKDTLKFSNELPRSKLTGYQNITMRIYPKG